MGKAKSQQHNAASRKKKRNSGIPEMQLCGNDGWVVVKKQRVTIIIPPLPATNQFKMPGAQNSRAQEKVRRTKKSEPQYIVEAHSQMLDDFDGEKSMSPVPEQAIPKADIVPPIQTTSTLPRLPRGNDMMARENVPPICRTNSYKTIGSRASKLTKRPIICTEKIPSLDLRMRTVNLEKKLRRAGGLRNWLLSLGLGGFVKIFEGRNVNKFQLANLTMQKLKDMGANAVGPRRKLIHAIECLCQPYCFEKFYVSQMY